MNSVTRKNHRRFRAEMVNGVQKVLRYVYIPGLKTFRTYLLSDQKFLIKEQEKKVFFGKNRESCLMTETLMANNSLHSCRNF